MRRTLKYALTAVLGVALVLPALAQNFPDTRDDHWAADALERMRREGLLVGYPDGLFRGGRPATRYEMAVAIHATYMYLKNLIDGMQTQIDALKGMDGFATKSELDEVRQALEALKADVANLRAQDIADLRKMVSMFEKELAQNKVDIEQMKRDLADIADRVTNLENRLPVDISGDLNFVVLAGYGDDEFGGLPGITVDGRPTGVDRRDDLPGVGMDRDATILHEGALTLVSARRTGARFKSTFVFSNMLDGSGVAFGDQASINSSIGGSFEPFREGDATFYIQNMSVAFDTSVMGAGMSAEVGRVGYMISPFIFKRPDNTPYFANDRWDNGEWTYDGAILGFGFGNAKVNLLLGRTMGNTSPAGMFSPRSAAVGISNAVQPMLDIDQFAGIHASLPIGENGSVNLAYLWLDSNATTATADDRLNIFGGDIRFNFGSFNVMGDFAQSNTSDGDETVVDEDNMAFSVGVGYNSTRWGAMVAWRQIEPLFSAPGDWGRIGTFWNPTDIEGFKAKGHFDLTNDLRFTGSYEQYNGVDDSAGFGGTDFFLDEDDEVTRMVVGIEYRLAANYDLALGVEEVRWNLDGQNFSGFGNDEVVQRWYNIGFGWNVAENAKLKFLWQVSDYKALEAHPAFQPFGGTWSAVRGGIATAQLSVKY